MRLLEFTGGIVVLVIFMVGGYSVVSEQLELRRKNREFKAWLAQEKDQSQGNQPLEK